MRIVCPSCDAAYMVPDEKLAPGRPARCACCGQQWVPIPAAQPALAAPRNPPPGAVAPRPSAAPALTASGPTAPGPDQAIPPAGTPESTGAPPPSEAPFRFVMPPAGTEPPSEPLGILASGAPRTGPARPGFPFTRPPRTAAPAATAMPRRPGQPPDGPAHPDFLPPSPPPGPRLPLGSSLPAQDPDWDSPTPRAERHDRMQRVGDWPVPLAVWIGWALTVLVLLAFAVIVYVGRDDIMRAWPPSIRFYTALGLPPD